ncbi:MAG: hypothetical protein IPF58_04910 [Saprospirales bacterium]|nr:hypothetical protein [Saprospirales bacterium]
MNPQSTGCHDVEWRAFEDDGVGSDANTGWQNICINFSILLKIIHGEH